MIGDEATEALRGVWQVVAALSGGLENPQGDVGRRKGKAEQSNGAAFVILLAFCT